MSKSHEVSMEKDCPVVDGSSERLSGVEVVVRAGGGRKLALGCFSANHREVVLRAVRGDIGAAENLIQLPHRRESDADVRAQVNAQVALHGEGGQDLCGIRLDGHAAREQLYVTGEIPRARAQ